MYEITITRTVINRKLVHGPWTVVGKEGNEEKYAYAPDREQFVEDNFEIYKQMVEEIDLVGVISAVNYQPGPLKKIVKEA